MSESPRLPDLSMGAGLVAILLLLGAFCAAPETGAQARATQVPMFNVDPKGNVWIAAAGQSEATAAARPAGASAAGGARPPAAPKPQDAHVIKFSRTGQFLLQIGHAGKVEGSDSKTGLNRPAAVRVDAATNEVYVADGLGNDRVVVFDAETGAYKRHWGADGETPDDANTGAYDPNAAPARQFRAVSCAAAAKE